MIFDAKSILLWLWHSTVRSVVVRVSVEQLKEAYRQECASLKNAHNISITTQRGSPKSPTNKALVITPALGYSGVGFEYLVGGI